MPNDTPSNKKYIASTSNISVDWTEDIDYHKLVEEEIEEYNNIEITEDLKEGGIHAHKAWVYWFQYLAENYWHTSFESEIVKHCNSVLNPKILSLGCGYGGYDLNIAKSLKSPYEITAIDLNERLFEKAREEAKKNNLNVKFESVDLNFATIKENTFDVIYAHASLHHVLNLEHLFLQIYNGLKRDGKLIVQDIIGKTQVLFWKENVEFASNTVDKMPAKYKAGIIDVNEIITPYVEPAIQKGMEGIRQEEIEEQISKFFIPAKMFKYGSFMRLLCTNSTLGQTLNPDIEEDRQYLEYLFLLDLKQVSDQNLRPTEMLAVFNKKIN